MCVGGGKDAGNVSATVSFSAADLLALEAGQWIYICQTFTLPSSATTLNGVTQVLELEASADGRCSLTNGGYSIANTCEVFAIAPDGFTVCPVTFGCGYTFDVAVVEDCGEFCY